MKVLGVAGSPRVEKSTKFALDTCLETIRSEFPGVETELVDLSKMKINGCLDCGTCKKGLSCSQEDDFKALTGILADANLGAVIIATPVYFGTMTSQTKAFLDRCVMLKRNGALLRNKVGGVIAVGGFRHGGQETAIHAVHAAMLIQDMIVVGDGNSTYHFGGTLWSGISGGYKQDAFGLETVKNLGRRVAEVALHMR